MAKQLYKSSTDKKFAGVSAGLADYFEVDVVLMRLLVFAVILFSGVIPGLIVYIVAAMIMPEETVVRNKSGKK